MPAPQHRFWIATIARESFTRPDVLPAGVAYLGGQLERGETTGFEHWQLILALSTKGTLAKVRSILGESGHYEATRSAAARAYCFKESTRIGEPFQLGTW